MDRYLALLTQTSAQLRTYSEWLLGRGLLEQIIADPTSLTLTRRDRVVLFMDVRNFTHWSETQSPEAVVEMLNQYYQQAESVLVHWKAIKFKFTADEVMAIFATVNQAAHAALDLDNLINMMLASKNLGVGIGLHTGPLVEGLLGTGAVKFYDVIGDTVNTAKRIESAANTSEILISDTVRQQIDPTFHVGIQREIEVKGKQIPLVVFPLQ